MPVAQKAKLGSVVLTFTDPIKAKTVEAKNFDVKVCGLKQTQNYGSKHIDENRGQSPRPHSVTMG